MRAALEPLATVKGIDMNTDNPHTDDYGIFKAYGDRIGRAREDSLDPESDQIITIEALLLALDRSGERDAVLSAIEKLQLSPMEAGGCVGSACLCLGEKRSAAEFRSGAAERRWFGSCIRGDHVARACETGDALLRAQRRPASHQLSERSRARRPERCRFSGTANSVRQCLDTITIDQNLRSRSA